MEPMIQNRFRVPVTRLITPLCRVMIRAGVSANTLTVIGAIGASISAIYFFSQDRLFIGTLVTSLFVLSDLFDGTMARLTNKEGTRWGALLDSTLDRVTDAAICIGIWIYLVNIGSSSQYLALMVLFLGGLIPYIRAKAESLGIECSVGMAERTERLILLLTGTGFAGLGLGIALDLALWILLVLSLITVAQRMRVVYRA